MTIQEMAKFALEIEENAERADVEAFALPGATLPTSPVAGVGQAQLPSMGFQPYLSKYQLQKMVCKGCHGG